MTEHKSLEEALAAFQSELPKLIKDEKADVRGETRDGRAYNRSYGYADLAQVVETVLPVLGKHGLSITSGTTFVGDQFLLEVTMLHASGSGERTSIWPLPDPRRSGPQDIGSSMTYGRRYLTLALSGAYPGGEDDDGAKAQASHRESWDDARPRTQQAMDQHRRGVSSTDEPAPAEKDWSKATDDEIRELHDKIENLPIGQAVNGYDWMAGKGVHERKIALPNPMATEDDAEPLMVSATEVLAYRLADDAVKPDVSRQAIALMRGYAEARGLLKLQVSETETLDQVLTEAKGRIDRAAHAALDDTNAALDRAGT